MTRDAGFDDFLDAVEAGEPYYLESPDGEAYLPPRPHDPATGRADLTERPLPEVGTLLSHTTTHVPTPRFDADAPYVTAIASFGPVRLTGQLRDLSVDEIDTGQRVILGVGRSATRDERLLVFRPRPPRH